MTTSLKTRAAALVASIFVTFTRVHLIADYALPEPTATVLAQVTTRA